MAATKKRLDITEWQELLRRVHSDISQSGFVYPKPLARLLEHSFRNPVADEWAADAIGKWYRMVDARRTAADARAVAKSLTEEERGRLLPELALVLNCLNEQRAAHLEWVVPSPLLAPDLPRIALADVMGAIAAATADLLAATCRLSLHLDDEKAWGLIEVLRRACLLWAAVPHAVRSTSFPYLPLTRVVVAHVLKSPQTRAEALQNLGLAVDLIPPAERADLRMKEQMQALIADALALLGHPQGLASERNAQ